MNSVTTIRLYLQLMLKEVEGTKVILLDRFTRRLLTLVYTHTEILQNDVLLIDMIDSRRDKLPNMKCIIFVSNTQDNVTKIIQEIKNPKYVNYHIYFTNELSEIKLNDIASADKKKLVESVKIIFTDYLSPDASFFILPVRSSIPLYGQGISNHESTFGRIAQGLISAVLTMTKKKPLLRYNRHSLACGKLSKELHHLLSGESTSKLFLPVKRTENNPLLILLDRRHDPITPLLSQWTYQAMIHENIGKGIRDNVVIVKKKKEKKKKEEENEGESEEEEFDDEEEDEDKKEDHEILFSRLHDDFLHKNKDKNWGEVCDEMKKLVNRFKVTMKSKDEMESVEDMKNFLDNYSEFKKLNRQTNDHMTLVFELKSQIQQRRLLHLSKLEQEIVCSLGTRKHGEQYKALVSLLRGRIRKDDALRLVLIYILRYESYDGNKIPILINILVESGYERTELSQLTDGILRYGGEKVRYTTELFRETKGIKGIFTRVKASLKDVENVFTQHDPLIKQIVDQELKGKLNVKSYPFAGLTQPASPSLNNNLSSRKIFLFFVGGITYEEVKCVREMNKEYRKKKVMIMLGGTRIVNSRTFVKEVTAFQEMIGNPY